MGNGHKEHNYSVDTATLRCWRSVRNSGVLLAPFPFDCQGHAAHDSTLVLISKNTDHVTNMKVNSIYKKFSNLIGVANIPATSTKNLSKVTRHSFSLCVRP